MTIKRWLTCQLYGHEWIDRGLLEPSMTAQYEAGEDAEHIRILGAYCFRCHIQRAIAWDARRHSNVELTLPSRGGFRPAWRHLKFRCLEAIR